MKSHFNKNQINIAILIPSLETGGAERVTATLATYLVGRNYKTTVITTMNQESDFFRLDDRVIRFCLGYNKDLTFTKKIFAFLNRFLILRALIKKEKYDIIIGMMTDSAVFAIIACFGFSTKVVISERNWPDKNKTGLILSLLRKALYRFSDAQVAQTSSMAKWLKMNTASNKVSIIPNSVNWPIPTTDPVLIPKNLLEDGDKLILAVGRLCEQKGFDMLILAFSSIFKEFPSWKLVIAGEDTSLETEKNYRSNLEYLVRQNNMTASVLMPGRIGNIATWYEHADLFVLSSRTEGFPNVLLEAMATGCACIAFNCQTGPKDIIQDGINGILVPDGDINTLSNKMRLLMQEGELRNALGTSAKSIHKAYSEDRIIGLWEDLFESISNIRN